MLCERVVKVRINKKKLTLLLHENDDGENGNGRIIPFNYGLVMDYMKVQLARSYLVMDYMKVQEAI